MITWYDIKLQTLQKMFATNNGSTTIPTDNSTREYISSMPGAANEALQMLATAGKFIIKSVDIANIPMTNLYPNGENIRSVSRGTIDFTVDNAHSLYFELKGSANLVITIGDLEFLNEDITSSSLGYVPYKYLIDNENNEKVTMTLTSDYPFSTKNVAFYEASWPTADEIQPFTENIRYDLSQIVDDFYQIDTKEVIYEGDAEVSRYTATSGFFQEGTKILLLPRTMPGNYKVHYKAYPQPITQDTTDDTVLSLDPEVAALLPLYMASQLYKDDDSGAATVYRNEFEVAFDRLTRSVKSPSSEHFVSESGWI